MVLFYSSKMLIYWSYFPPLCEAKTKQNSRNVHRYLKAHLQH